MIRFYLYAFFLCMLYFLGTMVLLIFFLNTSLHDFLIRSGLVSVAIAAVFVSLLYIQMKIYVKKHAQSNTDPPDTTDDESLEGKVISIFSYMKKK